MSNLVHVVTLLARSGIHAVTDCRAVAQAFDKMNQQVMGDVEAPINVGEIKGQASFFKAQAAPHFRNADWRFDAEKDFLAEISLFDGCPLFNNFLPLRQELDLAAIGQSQPAGTGRRRKAVGIIAPRKHHSRPSLLWLRRRSIGSSWDRWKAVAAFACTAGSVYHLPNCLGLTRNASWPRIQIASSV
ncbi:unnamed protein product [Polarella glacialis]|uniref:Uncharacterized protein n=1 Tax=Polarella glacialis TaxID=89957 RepID=A0A813JTN6_POLGL|nr:unnamed protein product [Polarella glacialis]